MIQVSVGSQRSVCKENIVDLDTSVGLVDQIS